MWIRWGIYTDLPEARFRNLAAAARSTLTAHATVKSVRSCGFVFVNRCFQLLCFTPSNLSSEHLNCFRARLGDPPGVMFQSIPQVLSHVVLLLQKKDF